MTPMRMLRAHRNYTPNLARSRSLANCRSVRPLQPRLSWTFVRLSDCASSVLRIVYVDGLKLRRSYNDDQHGKSLTNTSVARLNSHCWTSHECDIPLRRAQYE